jgi:cell division transport system permease protein
VALKVDYVLKETGRNLVRNPWLTVATILCVFVSIVLVGASLLTRSAAGNATKRWAGGVELVVYMNPDATQDQIDAVNRSLRDNPQVESFEYLDRDQAYEEFKDLFRDSPELIEAITPDALPTNFKVRPVRIEDQIVHSLERTFEDEPGVRQVVAANDAIRAIERMTNVVSVGMVIVAVALTVSALVLIGNTIQTAIFARRREIEVMKLVGATNWFIRVPFMLEGVIQGVLGSLLGIGGVYGLNWAFDRYIASDQDLTLLGSFTVASGDVFATAIFLLLGGILIGALASAVAVTFYVNV